MAVFTMRFLRIMVLGVHMPLVVLRMFRMSKNLKILDAIVRLVSIDVMNYFRDKEWSAKVFLQRKAMELLHFSIDLLDKIAFMQCWPRRMKQSVRVACTPPSIIMQTAEASRYRLLLAKRAGIHCAMLILPLVAACQSKPEPVLIGDATVQCKVNCVSVSKGFLKEHANLFDEVIRLRADKKLCQEKIP